LEKYIFKTVISVHKKEALRSNKYIVIADYFTKWIEVFLIPN